MIELALPPCKNSISKVWMKYEKYRVSRLSLGRENFSCLIANRARDILLFMLDTCCFQLSDSSMVIPRNLECVAWDSTTP